MKSNAITVSIVACLAGLGFTVWRLRDASQKLHANLYRRNTRQKELGDILCHRLKAAVLPGMRLECKIVAGSLDSLPILTMTKDSTKLTLQASEANKGYEYKISCLNHSTYFELDKLAKALVTRANELTREYCLSQNSALC